MPDAALTFANALLEANKMTCPKCDTNTHITKKGMTNGHYQYFCHDGSHTFTLARLQPQLVAHATDAGAGQDTMRGIMALRPSGSKRRNGTNPDSDPEEVEGPNKRPATKTNENFDGNARLGLG